MIDTRLGGIINFMIGLATGIVVAGILFLAYGGALLVWVAKRLTSL